MYPIYYLDYHKCLHCGQYTVVAKSRGGSTNESLLYPTLYMECKTCGEIFYLKWIDSPDNPEEIIPVLAGEEVMMDVAKNIIYSGKKDVLQGLDELKHVKIRSKKYK